MNPNETFLVTFYENNNQSFNSFINQLVTDEVKTVANFINSSDKYIYNRQRAIRNNALRLNEIIKSRGYYINYQLNNEENIILPFSIDGDMLNNFINAIKKLHDIILNKNTRFDVEIANTIDLYYGINSNYSSKEQIAIQQKVSAQTVINRLFENSSICTIFAGKVVNRIQLNEQFISQIEKFKSDFLYKTNFIRTITTAEDPDKNLINQFLEVIKCDIADIENTNELFLVEKDNVGYFKDHYRSISQTVKNILFPISLDDFMKIVKKELGINTVFNPNIFNALLLQHPYIEQIEENNELKHRCKWEYLSSVDFKLKRILLDEYRQMTKQEISDEYNNRAQKTNIDKLNYFTITQDDNFKLCGGNGNWVYVKVFEGTGIDIDQNLTEFIEQFFNTQEGKATYFEILNAVKEIGIFKHTEGSIRAAIFNIASASINDNNLFIHDDYAKQYPEIKLAPNRQLHLGHKFAIKLIDLLKNAPSNVLENSLLSKKIIEKLNVDGVIISNGNCSQYLRIFLNDDDAIIREYSENGKRLIKLDLEKLQFCDLEKIGKKKEKEYITTFRAFAINNLKFIEDRKAPKIDILNNFKAENESPEHLKSDSIFYKILNDKSIFETISIDGLTYVQLRLDKEIVRKPFTEEIKEEIVEKELVENINDYTQIQPYNQRQQYAWEQIRTNFSTELYHFRLNEQVLELGVNSFYNALMKNNQIDFWGSQLLQTISNLWFCQTDKYDRHIYLRTMINDFETYLKRFDSFQNNTTGLRTVIDSIPVLNDLRNYDEICSISRVENYDRTKRSFSIIINRLISLRNKSTHNASHPVFDMGQYTQTKNLTDFIALYVYTAYLLNNHFNDHNS